MPLKKTINGAPYHRSLPVRHVRVVSEETRQIELSFSSEEPYERWFGMEILSHDEGAVNMERLAQVGSLLFSHGRDPTIGRIPPGRIISTVLDLESRRGTAIVAFDSDEKSELLYQKVKSGAIRGVSVGYEIDAVEEVKAGKSSANGRFSGPCVVATRWSPFEISIEPTPADFTVGIGRSIIEITDEGEMNLMPATTNIPDEKGVQPAAAPPDVPPATPVPPPDLHRARAEAATAERARICEITEMCRDFGMNPEEHIQSERSVDEVRSAVMAALRAGTGADPLPAANVEVTAEEEDKFRAAARDGLMLRMGYQPEKLADGAGDFRGMTLRNLAANCLMRQDSGSEAMRMGDDDLLRAVLGFGSRSVAQPDSAFASIVNNTMGAMLSQGYATAGTTFQLWTGTGSNPNFKVAKRYRLSGAGEPVEIKQGGEFKADSVTDEGVDTRLSTYGKKFAFTREAFINDDLGTLSKAVLAQTRSFRRAINRQVYELLGKNQAYTLDKKTMFHADHKNLGTAGALCAATLGQMYTLMSLQKDLSGKEALNLSPKFGLFPVALSMEARKLLNSLSDPDANHSGVINPVQGLVTPIFDAELDKYSATAHYVVADPGDVDTVEVGYYNGKAEPTLESRTSWDILGIEYRMYHDWYVALLDYRGLAANMGV